VTAAVGYAAWRRYAGPPGRLKRGWKPSAVLFFFFFLMLSVLFTLAFHRAHAGMPPSPWAPLSSGIAAAFAGLPAPLKTAGFYACWWAHLLILLAFAVYVPQSKHFHLLAAPVNLLLRRTDPPGSLRPLDPEAESAESFGVGKIEGFRRLQMLDLFACVECGRCTAACPASNTGKLLSPMHLITKLRDHLVEKGAAVTSASPWVPAYAFAGRQGAGAHAMAPDAAPSFRESAAVTDIAPTMRAQERAWRRSGKAPEDVSLIGDVIREEEIWACTTCRNCEAMCPVGNEHVDKIVDLRRYLVLTEGKPPSGGQRVMQNIERQGNPWGLHRGSRADWVKDAAREFGVRVPTVRENPGFDVLFFVGSMGSYDLRTRKVTLAVVRLLAEAGVNFAILGNEEQNSGDTPRRLGNEWLFQECARENIALFERYGVKRIVTACPHTYNVLKNEYPAFGLRAEVLHHTELLDRLVRDGKLVPRHAVAQRVVFHDPCYLGRYNGGYEPPRRLLEAVPGLELREMERSRENAMCCGAGGGRMWAEENEGKRVNLARAEQALAAGPDLVGAACPYCLAMLEDGLKAAGADGRAAAVDVAEILAWSVFGRERE